MTDLEFSRNRRAVSLDPESPQEQTRLASIFYRTQKPRTRLQPFKIWEEIDLSKVDRSVERIELFPCSWDDPLSANGRVLLGHEQVLVTSFSWSPSLGINEADVAQELNQSRALIRFGKSTLKCPLVETRLRIDSGAFGAFMSPSQRYFKVWSHKVFLRAIVGVPLSFAYEMGPLDLPVKFVFSVSGHLEVPSFRRNDS